MNENESTAPKADAAGTTGLTLLHAYGFNIAVVVTLALAVAGGMRLFGKLEERSSAAHEKITRIDGQMAALNERLDTQVGAVNRRIDDQYAALNEAREAALSEIRTAISALQGATQEEPILFVNGSLTSGFDMAINTSGGLTDWVSVANGVMCMNYPAGQHWGAVFVTVGQPSGHPRAGKDFSHYRSLVVEARGIAGGESVLVGLKDNTDPDDGSETKVPLSGLTVDWQRYEIELTRFRTADLTRLYIPIEFVFQTTPGEICVRKIEYLR